MVPIRDAQLSDASQNALKLYRNRCSFTEFMLFQAEGLPSFITENAYNEEEAKFLQKYETVHVKKLSTNSNIITTHAVYRLRKLGNGKIVCKARISPPGNEDEENETLRPDCAVRSPLRLRLFLSCASLYNLHLSKEDVKSALLQSGSANRVVFM